ncbi:MAG: ankyrin repeat domain-containing protein [Armatimonadetes bacterium]|nr:ankyrin repeat domain-containing protein [Armatimonadota bacterium]
MKKNFLLIFFICSLNLFGTFVEHPLYFYVDKSDLIISGEIVKIIKDPNIERNNEFSANDIYYACISIIYNNLPTINDSINIVSKNTDQTNIAVNDTIEFYLSEFFNSFGNFPSIGESGILYLELKEKKLRLIPQLGVQSFEKEDILIELCKKDNISKELILAINNDDIIQIKRIVELGALKIPSGYYLKYFEVTPVIQAVRRNNKEIVKYLIQHGADIKQNTLSGISLLKSAIMINNIEIIKLLVRNGANLSKRDSRGNTLLMYVLGYPSIKMIKYLLKNGININAQNNNGNTALLMHIQRNSPDLKLVKFLLKKGADPRITNNDRKDGYDFVDKDDNVLLELLKKHE